MSSSHVTRVVTVTLTAATAFAGASATASATSIIGFGNSAHNNTCINAGSAVARGLTALHPGIATALNAAVPFDGPTNQCGGLGANYKPLGDRLIVRAIEE
ncbi:hypothetical protein [Streptomyces sp. DH12]|uniref:hypothetical protein n=1 Tax=Streptomyces sp. DH12 TaxID=2857010 RepID=UPI001E389F3E|nr:hypothetical protein [Streptomyces sp. DH12]